MVAAGIRRVVRRLVAAETGVDELRESVGLQGLLLRGAGMEAGLDPYDPATLSEALRTDGFKFNYPPYALGAFAPFTLLPLPQALLLYLALKLIVLGWLVRIWSRLLGTGSTEPAWILFLIFAYSSTIFIDVVSGSVTTFEQALLWVGIAALLEKRYWVYVVAVVAASLFRLAPILLLLVCLVVPDRRRYRYIASGVAAFACIFLLTTW